MSLMENTVCGMLVVVWLWCGTFSGVSTLPSSFSPRSISFQYSSCRDLEESNLLCSRARNVLEMLRRNITAGVDVGGRKLVLDPLHLEDFINITSPISLSWKITNTLTGVKDFIMKEMKMSGSYMEAEISYPHLEYTVMLNSENSLMPAAPQFEILLQDFDVKLSASWLLSGEERKFTASDIKVDLDLDALQTKITNVPIVGPILQQSINENSKEIVAYIIPYVENYSEQVYNLKAMTKEDFLRLVSN